MQKRKWTFSTRSLPDFVKEWFTPLVPGFLAVLLAWVFAYVLNIDLYSVVAKIISPLLSTSDTFAAFVGTAFFLTALFAVSINGAVTFGIMFPLWFAAMGENTALVTQGLEPIHINTIQVISAFCVLGGTGSTLALNFLMLRSKSDTMKSLGKAGIVPSLMNINEPLIFGLPIAFNPILAIPFILNGGVINPILTFLAMNSGLVSKPVNPLIMPWVPVGVTGFLYTQDFKAVLLTAVLLVINLLVWHPFFKSYEKTMIAKETKTK